MTDKVAVEPISHVLMFWLLAGMGVAVALPCFLVPPINALGQLAAVERREQMRTAELEQQITQQHKLLEALRSDPLLNARLAQRELGYQMPGEVRVVGQALPVVPPAAQNSMPSIPDTFPQWVRTIYPAELAHVYSNNTSRQLLAIISISLIIFAILTFARKAAGVSNESVVQSSTA
ncbi:MAG: hypothetical protein HJJLKODD_02281 [Phycisphaerae bacterium]|nr:hypothetical protein [Phycisphaerae bacterium]